MNSNDKGTGYVCPNCKMAINNAAILRRGEWGGDFQPSSAEILREKIKHLVKYCPGDPWCDMTDTDKDKLWQ